MSHHVPGQSDRIDRVIPSPDAQHGHGLSRRFAARGLRRRSQRRRCLHRVGRLRPGGYCTRAGATAGEVSDCPDGAICDAIAGQAMACVKICAIQSDCRDDQQCNGTTGSSLKACKPK
jgi:hypothetical protein